jgi:hypothetical protein
MRVKNVLHHDLHPIEALPTRVEHIAQHAPTRKREIGCEGPHVGHHDQEAHQDPVHHARAASSVESIDVRDAILSPP